MVRRVRKISKTHILDAVVGRNAAPRRLIDELFGLFGDRTQPIIADVVDSGTLTLKNLQEAEQALQRFAGQG